FVDKAVKADRDTIELVGKAVVGNHGRDSGKQTDSCGDQGFGNTGSHRGQGGLLHAGQTDKGVHDPPDGTQQPDVWADRTGRGQEVQVCFQCVHFALVAGAHGTAWTVQQGWARALAATGL